MENKPEPKVSYVVKQSSSGEWEVNESGFDKPIASLPTRDEALDYAQRLAATKESADIRCE